jgi:hypothetical protein
VEYLRYFGGIKTSDVRSTREIKLKVALHMQYSTRRRLFRQQIGLKV